MFQSPMSIVLMSIGLVVERSRASALVSGVQVVVIEDYAKGLLSRELCALVIGVAKKARKPVLV